MLLLVLGRVTLTRVWVGLPSGSSLRVAAIDDDRRDDRSADWLRVLCHARYMPRSARRAASCLVRTG